MTQINPIPPSPDDGKFPAPIPGSNELLPSHYYAPQLPLANWSEARALAKYVAASGYYADIRNEAQALMKIGMGIELGIGPMAAVKGIFVDDKGSITLSANLQAGLVQRSTRYKYEVTKLTEAECSIEFFERYTASPDGWKSLGLSTLTMQQARAANLDQSWDRKLNNGNGGWKEKHTWKSFPRNMLFARCISNGTKWFCPAVTNGLTIYDPDELDGLPPDKIATLPSANQDRPDTQNISQAPISQAGDISQTATTTTTTTTETPPDPPKTVDSPPINSSSSGAAPAQKLPDDADGARKIWVIWHNKAAKAKAAYPEKSKWIENVLSVNRKAKDDAKPEIVLHAAYLIMRAVCEVTGEAPDAALSTINKA
jgi:hypothetical protein